MSTHKENDVLDDIHKSKRKRGRETKRKIFLLVEENEPEGLTLGELVDATKEVFPPNGLHRDRVGDICKEYVGRGLLSQFPKKKGKFGRYRLGPNAYGDPRLAAFILQQKIMDPRIFFQLGTMAICDSSRFCSAFYQSLFRSREQKEYREIENKSDEFDQLYLFEYSLRLGSIMVYQLIQAIKHAEASPLLSTLQKDDFVLKWIEKATNPMSIVQTFRRLLPVNKRLAKSKQAESVQDDESIGWLELEKGKIDELENIFRKVFGDSLVEDLGKIKREFLGNDVREHKHRLSESGRIEQLWKEDPDHIKCGGMAESEAIKRMGVISNSNGQKVNIYSRGQDIQPIKRCSRCGRRIVMRWMTPRKI